MEQIPRTEDIVHIVSDDTAVRLSFSLLFTV